MNMKWKTEDEMNRRLLTAAYKVVSEQVMDTVGPGVSKKVVRLLMRTTRLRKQVVNLFLDYLSMFNPLEARNVTYKKVAAQLAWFPDGQDERKGEVGNAAEMKAAYLRLMRELNCKVLDENNDNKYFTNDGNRVMM